MNHTTRPNNVVRKPIYNFLKSKNIKVCLKFIKHEFIGINCSISIPRD